jgi:hypothetical protein
MWRWWRRCESLREADTVLATPKATAAGQVHVLSKPCAERICKLKAIADEEKPPALIAYLELQGEKARYLGSTGIAEKLLDQAASRMSNFIYGKPRVRYINVLKRSTAVSAVGALEATDLRVSSLC